MPIDEIRATRFDGLRCRGRSAKLGHMEHDIRRVSGSRQWSLRSILSARPMLVALTVLGTVVAVASVAQSSQASTTVSPTLGTIAATSNLSAPADIAANPKTTKTDPSPAIHENIAPLPGEGLIALTRRVCGSGDTWRAQAEQNGVAAGANGQYWLYRSDRLTIDCGLSAASAAKVDPAPVQEQAVQPAAPAKFWYYPLPGRCRAHGGGGDFAPPRPLGATGSAIRYRHQGVDLGASTGTPIHNVGAGEVVFAGYAGNAGLQVQVQSGEVRFKYNHLNEKYVSRGDSVGSDQVIGTVGETGDAVGAHLHLEVWVNGQLVNAGDFLRGTGAGEVYC